MSVAESGVEGPLCDSFKSLLYANVLLFLENQPWLRGTCPVNLRLAV